MQKIHKDFLGGPTSGECSNHEEKISSWAEFGQFKQIYNHI